MTLLVNSERYLILWTCIAKIQAYFHTETPANEPDTWIVQRTAVLTMALYQ